MRTFAKPTAIRLDDEKAERARREHAQAIAEIQAQLPDKQIIGNVKLVDGVETTIQHALGRLPQMVTTSAVRGATTTGRIEEIRSGKVSRDRAIVLKATGYTAAITVDVEVE